MLLRRRLGGGRADGRPIPVQPVEHDQGLGLAPRNRLHALVCRPRLHALLRRPCPLTPFTAPDPTGSGAAPDGVDGCAPDGAHDGGGAGAAVSTSRRRVPAGRACFAGSSAKHAPAHHTPSGSSPHCAGAKRPRRGASSPKATPSACAPSSDDPTARVASRTRARHRRRLARTVCRSTGCRS